jgi:adenylosuccinate lyase
MASIWSEKGKFQRWLDVEIAVCEVLNKEGWIPDRDMKRIKSKASFDVTRIEEIEKRVKHDVIAFLTNVAEHVGKSARFIHTGLTSSDVVDTGNALRIRDACRILIQQMHDLLKILQRRSREHKSTVMVGRTHGIHAEPITLGLKFALWYEEMNRNLRRLKQAQEELLVGKFSGSVGTFAYLSPHIEKKVCRKLGLKVDPISNQIIQRDRYAFLFAVLAIIASSLDKFATEIRNLQRTEIQEVEEYFSKGQKGSSSMPHKRNPVSCEQISGLARIVRANCMAAFENIPLWHERDISHSSVERVILPDSTILVHYMLYQFKGIVERLFVYPERMLENLRRTKGLIFSQSLLLALVQKGTMREEAYLWVQRNAMKAWQEQKDFKELVKRDRNIKTVLSDRAIEDCFRIENNLRNIDKIYQRVFRKSSPRSK